MKYLRLSMDAAILTFVLATSTLAGEMPLPGVASPAPPSAAGEMPYPVAAFTDAATEIALGLVQSVLSQF